MLSARQGFSLGDVAGDLYVAVQTGSSINISTDLINWQRVVLPLPFAVYAGVHAEDTYQLITLYQDSIQTSPNGVTWYRQLVGLPANSDWIEIIYANNRYVALTNSNQNVMAYSVGINNWRRSNGLFGVYNRITYSPVLQQFVVIDTTQARCGFSYDGINWTSVATPEVFSSIAYGDGYIMACRRNSNQIYYTEDLVTWVSATLPATADWQDIAYGDETFVVIDTTNRSARAVKTNNSYSTWTSVTLPNDIEYELPTRIRYLNNRYIVVFAGSGNKAFFSNLIINSSDQGVTWTSGTLFTSANWVNVLYPTTPVSAPANMMVAAGSNRIWTGGRPGGSAFWEQQNTQTATHNAVTWGRLQFVAVGASSCYTSSDGVTWTSQTIPAGTYRSVVWYFDRYVAVGANVCATSPDGVTWTSRTIPAGTYYSVIRLGTQFVAVGDNVCATSPDGISWLSRSIPSGSYFSLVAGRRIAVAVGTDVCATTTDGVTWTSQTIPTGRYRSVTYNGQIFVTVSRTDILTSIDGITWASSALSTPSTSDFTGSTPYNQQYSPGLYLNDFYLVNAQDVYRLSYRSNSNNPIFNFSPNNVTTNFGDIINNDPQRILGPWPNWGKLRASDAQAEDRFGWSVSISGDGNTAIVGAFFEDAGGTDAGAAYIFTRSGTTWTQVAKITASDAQAEDWFGWSVSISSDGNTAIVGAPYEDAVGDRAGAAYIFTRSGTTWTQQAKITASDAEVNDEFGRSVSISSDGNTAVVSAPLEDAAGGNAGAAYIFTRSGTTWTQQAKITASDAEAGDIFGWSVSISSDGNTAIAGAYFEAAGGNRAGAAYIFTRSGITWTQQAKITASDAEVNDEFGRSVSISSDGNTAIVGAWGEDAGGTDAGAAYIFTRSGTTWTQQAKITASDAQSYDRFGWSVSISSDGNTAIVGAYFEDAAGLNAGAAYIFTRSGTTWTQVAKITASDAQAEDQFGQSVSISGDGNTALVGAYAENASGAAYIFYNT